MRKFEQSFEFTTLLAQWMDIINSHDVYGTTSYQISTKKDHDIASLAPFGCITYDINGRSNTAEEISHFGLQIERMARHLATHRSGVDLTVDVKFFAAEDSAQKKCLSHYRWKVSDGSFSAITPQELTTSILPGWDFSCEEPDILLPITDNIYNMSFFKVSPGFYSLVLHIDAKAKTRHRFAVNDDGSVTTLGDKESYSLKRDIVRCLYADKATISVYRLGADTLDQTRVRSTEAVSRMRVDEKGWTSVPLP